MLNYILCRIEGNKEYQVMTSTSLELARKEGEQFKDGYAIYEVNMIEYSIPSDEKISN